MIQPGTKLKVADNTGAKIIEVFNILGNTKQKHAQIGDIVVASVKKAEPRKMIERREVVKAVIVRQRKEFKRRDGSYIRFNENAAVILDGKLPKGGRIFGPVPRELKDYGFKEITVLAREIIWR